MNFLSKSILLSSLFWSVGCGVKGKPMPPLTAPVLGRGEPNYSKATENLKLKKKQRANDWDDSGDFPEESEK